jgi:alpha-L-fucosidase
LKINGEAIYNAKLWRKYGEGPTQIVEGQFSDGIKKNFTSKDFRFTTNNGYLYATALKCSDNGDYCIRSLGKQDASRQANFHGIIDNVQVLGSDNIPTWTRTEDGLHLHTTLKSKNPIVFKIKIQ